MLENITIGQYFPTGSILHKLDSRIKIILTIVFIVTVFLAESFLSLAICALVILSLVFASKVKLSTYLKMLKSIWFVIALTSILNIFYIKGETPLFSWWIFTVYPEGIERAIFIAVRICLLIVISSLLTYTTSPTELTDAIERLLSPLRFVGLGEAVHILAMMTSIALRFIPILIEETDKIMSAQKARGSNLDTGGLMQKIKAMLPILIPLIISATRRAYDLAEAMECRCYQGGNGRTKLKQMHMSARDYIALAVSVLFIFVVIADKVWSFI